MATISNSWRVAKYFSSPSVSMSWWRYLKQLLGTGLSCHHLILTEPLPSAPPTTRFLLFGCVCWWTRASLTQAAAVARHGHEGPEWSADDAVRPTQGRLLEGAGVLVQEGVHAVGGGGPAIPHEGLWNTERNWCFKKINKYVQHNSVYSGYKSQLMEMHLNQLLPV